MWKDQESVTSGMESSDKTRHSERSHSEWRVRDKVARDTSGEGQCTSERRERRNENEPGMTCFIRNGEKKFWFF
jgi:hypothetical protein